MDQKYCNKIQGAKESVTRYKKDIRGCEYLYNCRIPADMGADIRTGNRDGGY